MDDTMKPEIIQRKFLGMQLCIPEKFTDADILGFAEKENPCGTTCG